MSRWQDDACVIISTRGTREEILAGGGVERVYLRWPAHVARLTEAELDHAVSVMDAWDLARTTRRTERAIDE